MTNCKSVSCADKSGAASNSDCVSHHSKCRLVQGGTTCQDAKPLCSYYTFSSSATDANKQAYCGSITTSSGGFCAYETATSANCVARTSCSQWSTDIGGGVTCPSYTGSGKCVVNTNVCYTKAACTSYTIPNSVSAGNEGTWCGNMSNTDGNACIFTSGTTCSTPAATPAAPTTCEGNASTASLTSASCNTTLESVDCQMFNDGTARKCYTTKITCTSYSTTGIASGQESAYCTALKADNAGVATQCKYVSGTTCSVKTCADVTSGATDQTSCDRVSSGCKYYAGGCYTILACASYTTPSSASSEILKRKFCQNVVNTSGAYCSYAVGGTTTTCADPKTDSGSIDGTSTDICGHLRLGTGQACMWVTSATKCSAPATGDVCTAVTAISTDSCDLYTTVGACDVASNNCSANAACTGQNFGGASTSDDKATACQLLNEAAGYCTWTTGSACEIASPACTGWASLTTTADNTAFCKARIDKTGAKCSYSAGAATCRTGSLCEFASTPGCQADCDFISSGCIYYDSKCYAKQTNCNLYFATGGDNAAKLTYCGTLKNSSGVACTFIHEGTTCVNKAACSTYTVSSASDKTAA